MSAAIIKTEASQKRRNFISKFLIYFFLIVITACMLLPFLWMLSSSFKLNKDVFGFPIQWIPKNPRWQNYGLARAAVEEHDRASRFFLDERAVHAAVRESLMPQQLSRRNFRAIEDDQPQPVGARRGCGLPARHFSHETFADKTRSIHRATLMNERQHLQNRPTVGIHCSCRMPVMAQRIRLLQRMTPQRRHAKLLTRAIRQYARNRHDFRLVQRRRIERRAHVQRTEQHFLKQRLNTQPRLPEDRLGRGL